MKVLHIVPNRSYGGIQRVCNFLEVSLNDFGVESETVFYLDLARTSTVRFYSPILLQKIFKWVMIRRFILDEISRYSPDVIIAHNAIVPILIPLKRNRLAFVVHGPIAPPEKVGTFGKFKKIALFYGAVIFSKCTVCVSEGLRSSVNSYFRRRLSVIHNPPSVQAMSDNSIKEKFSYLERFKGIKLVQFGRYCYQKNQSFSLDLVLALKKRGLSTQLVLLGDGDDYFYLLDKVKELGLSFCTIEETPNESVDVVFHEPVLGLRWLPEVFDMALFPSRYEGFSMGVLECLSINLPVLTSDCNFGPREIYEFFLANNKAGEGESTCCIRILSDEFKSEEVFRCWLNDIILVKKNERVSNFGVSGSELSRLSSEKWHQLITKSF